MNQSPAEAKRRRGWWWLLVLLVFIPIPYEGLWLPAIFAFFDSLNVLLPSNF